MEISTVQSARRKVWIGTKQQAVRYCDPSIPRHGGTHIELLRKLVGQIPSSSAVKMAISAGYRLK